ncbi:MAG: TlpA family protein disulfide reductase [Bacteroidales bacterium]|nr:TlpA family protein disulfide reductase [Bacteroidales bacterium]
MTRNCILALLLFPLMAFAAGNSVTISGRVNQTNALVRLLACDDLLNVHEIEAGRTYSDDHGFFLLEGKVATTSPARIAVGLESVDLYVTPGASYEVAITIPDVDPSASYFERQVPTIKVKTATDKGIYRQIVVSEQIIDGYVLAYFDALYRKRQYRYLDSIKATIDDELDISDDYVRQHNTYKIAAVQMAVNADGGKKVINELYDGKPVLYLCQSYMDLFKDLFVNKFYQAPYDMGEFQDAFWTGPKAFKTYLFTDPFMARNPRLAEMIMVYNLEGMYYEQSKLRKAVRAHLKSLAENSAYPETKAMIKHLFAEIDRLASGADAMDFELPDADGTMVKLSDYKDKCVVLQFVEGGSATVEHQFATLADLHQQWQDQVQLITITTKDQFASHRKRFDEHHYDWPLLNLGNDILLLEQYEVRTFPEYFIVKKGTKIGMAPAPSPDQTLDEYVKGMLSH